ncbi:hypothetical protein AOQ84DRAFT_389960 [Glonium stellatum]|uniref:Uncharacterized protein n=1 Tax=Glonium stellatum TaxID=574774 RepID=A0A8E2EY37_9PEZI|nr:hypothetical protein AOQ84DRAFT_389960 [Glonium stellatum]
MPPWLPHQWQAICSRLHFALLRRSFYIPIERPSRPFATATPKLRPLHNLPKSSSINSAGKKSVPDLQSVIASHQIHKTTPEDIIAHIKYYPIDVDQSYKEPLAIFFLTPSFAKWLLDDEIFLRKALKKAYKHTINNPEIDQTIHTLVAVVDRLPAPSSTGGSENGIDGVATRVRPPPVAKNGYEGVAYSFGDISYLPSGGGGSQEMTDILDGSPSTISLRSFLKFKDDCKTQTLDAIIQIPLANTIFHTGYSATMFSHRWKKPKGTTDINLEKKTQLKHQSIHWPDTLWGERPVTFSVPLIPLTTPRCIEAGMGNIVRRVLGPGRKSMTASQELEESVPQYFIARGIPPHAMTVWALVIPEDTVLPLVQKMAHLLTEDVSESEIAETDTLDLSSSLQTLWKRNPPVWNDMVWSAVKQGARLHRVLSGGGGWGKKAGLLSLDPDLSYKQLRETPHDSALEMSASEDLSTLHEVAKPGEFIQFFMSPTDGDKTREIHTEGAKDVSVESRIWSLEFGTISSSIDSMPESTSEGATDSSYPSIRVFRKHFGALSEGGMSIIRSRQAEKMGPWDTIVRSKVDVPYTRFSAVRFKNAKRSKDVSGAKVLESKRRTDDSQEMSTHRDLLADYPEKPPLSVEKIQYTQNTGSLAAIWKEKQQENRSIKNKISERASEIRHKSSSKEHDPVDKLSSPHKYDGPLPKPSKYPAVASDGIGLKKTMVPSATRIQRRKVRYIAAIKGHSQVLESLRKLKNIGDEVVSLRQEFAKVAMARRRRYLNRRNTITKPNVQPSSENSKNTSDLKPQLGSSTPFVLRKAIFKHSMYSSALSQTDYISRKVELLHYNLGEAIRKILKRKLAEDLASSVLRQDGIAITHKQISAESSGERLPLQAIANTPTSKANAAKTKDFLILLREKNFELRSISRAGHAADIRRSRQIQRRGCFSLVLGTGWLSSQKVAFRKHKYGGRFRKFAYKINFRKLETERNVIRKHIAGDHTHLARGRLIRQRRVIVSETASLRRKNTARSRELNSKELHPEAQKLADEVEKWMQGF